jgi:phenylacetic acid degradation operon negative regulatory protein
MARSAAGTAAHGIVAAARKDGGLKAGSLLVTIFGDAIAPRGGEITLAGLIRIAASFGLGERHVRTAVGRLATAGWLVARRKGRLSAYRLSREGQAQFRAATERIYGRPPSRWSGEWTLVLAPRLPARQRREFAWLGYGVLPGGLLAHPARDAREAGRVLGARAALVLTARSARASADAALVTAGWDLASLGRRYAQFAERFAGAERALEPRSSDETAFVLRTLLVHEYRRVHLRDPLLPPSLLPPGWAGESAYRLCARLYARLYAAAERHLSRVGGTLKGALPAPERSAVLRFGGLRPRRRAR